MSYDINLFAPVPGEDPIVTAQRDLDESEASQSLTQDAKARNARIAHGPLLIPLPRARRDSIAALFRRLPFPR